MLCRTCQLCSSFCDRERLLSSLLPVAPLCSSPQKWDNLFEAQIRQVIPLLESPRGFPSHTGLPYKSKSRRIWSSPKTKMAGHALCSCSPATRAFLSLECGNHFPSGALCSDSFSETPHPCCAQISAHKGTSPDRPSTTPRPQMPPTHCACLPCPTLHLGIFATFPLDWHFLVVLFFFSSPRM